MNLSCGSRTIKYLIFSFNFFFAITGIILIAVGASIHAHYIEYNFFLSNHYFSLPNLLIATGSIIFFICFLGCYGAVKNSWILLLLFSVLLGVIFIFEFSAGIAGYVLRDKTEGFLETSMKETIDEYMQGKQPAMHMWDTIQDNFKCCGVTSINDWGNSTDPRLPISCCPRQDGAKGTFTCSKIPPTLHTEKPITAQTEASTTTKPVVNRTLGKRQADNAGNSNNGNESSSTTNNATAAQTSASTPGSSSTEPTSSINTSTSRPSSSPIPADNSTTTTLSPSSTTIPYPEGCAQSFGSWVKVHAVDIGAVCFTLAVLQLIGIGFACHLSQQMKKAYYST